MSGLLSDLLYNTPKAYWSEKLSGLLDAASLGASTYAGATQPYTADQAKTIGGLLADFTPVVGDVKSGYEGVQAAREGDWLGAGMGALGALPFVPGMGGIIKQTGNLPKSLKLPGDIASARKLPIIGTLPENAAWDSGGMIRENMQARLSALQNGDFLVQGIPFWGAKNKPFFAVGDDASELAQYATDRLARGDKAIGAAAARKLKNSFAGKLQSATGDEFSHFNSARSDSTYAIHNGTGAKIRVSDHSLPGHYDAPDLSIPSWTPEADQIGYIRKYIESLKSGNHDAASQVQSEVAKLWK